MIERLHSRKRAPKTPGIRTGHLLAFVLQSCFFFSMCYGSASPPFANSARVVSAVKNPSSTLVRGEVIRITPGIHTVAGIRDIPITIATIRVDEMLHGESIKEIMVVSHCSLKVRNDPNRPIEITRTEGCVWYKIGDQVLILAEPFKNEPSLEGLYAARIVRFLSKGATSGEERTYYQEKCSFKAVASLARKGIESGAKPSIEELYRAIDRSVVDNGTIAETVSQLDSLRVK